MNPVHFNRRASGGSHQTRACLHSSEGQTGTGICGRGLIHCRCSQRRVGRVRWMDLRSTQKGNERGPASVWSGSAAGRP